MPENVYRPFDEDVEKHGAYRYTNVEISSAAYVNNRFSEVILSSLDLRGKNVVDVGCGDGTYTAVLRAKGGASHVLGIDPAAKAIERARRLYDGVEGLEFRTGLAGDLVREGRRFDVAVYRGVIHHVGDPPGEIAAALGLADSVFLLEPNGWNPIVKILEKFSRYHREHGERSYRLGCYRQWIAASKGSVKTSFFFGLVPIFSPDWMVALGSALEPLVERIPVLRAVCCGQVAIVAAPLPNL